MRQSIALIVAVVLGGLVAYAVGSSCNVASAQTLRPSAEVLNEGQAREMRHWLEKSNSSDFAERSRWRRILTRASRSSFGSKPVLAGRLVSGGLVTAAAGIWIHNGIMLYEIGQCGDVSCPVPIKLDAEFERTAGMGNWVGYWGPNNYWESNDMSNVSTVTGSLVIISVDYDAPSETVTYNYSKTGDVSGASFSTPTFDGTCSNTLALASSHTVNYSSSPQSWERPGSGQVMKFSWRGGGLGVCTPVDVSLSQTNPLWDVGGVEEVSVPPEYQPTEGDYVPSGQERSDFYNDIKADPEYKPTTDEPPLEEEWQKQHERRVGELIPTHGPEEWTRTNPDGSRTTRFRDGTEITTSPDKTEMVRRSDGTEEWTYPDGTTKRVTPDGTETTTSPDGTIRTRRPDGTETTKWPDGTTRTRRDGQPDEWTNPDGTVRPTPTPEEITQKYPEPKPAPNPSPNAGPGGSGTTNQGPDGCASPRTMTFDLPEIPLQDHFPFSLMLKAWDWMSMLVSTPSAPSFTLPMFGTISPPPAMNSVASAVRTVIGLVVGIGMSFWFYRYITGKGSDG